MLRRFMLLSGVFMCLVASPVSSGAQSRAEDDSWRASSAQMEARIQALLDDLRRRMDEIATAQSPGGQAAVGEVEELIAIQRRLRILELRQREAQILADMMASLRRARSEFAGDDPAPDPAPASVPPPLSQTPANMDFRILSVSGSGEALRAAVWSERTGRINVTAGTRLPDGTVISRVEVDGIWVRRPGSDVEIPLGQAESGQATAAGTPPIVSIAPPPSPPPASLSRPPSFSQPPFLSGGGAQQPPRPGGGFGLGVPSEGGMAGSVPRPGVGGMMPPSPPMVPNPR